MLENMFYPDEWKDAVIYPILKKTEQDNLTIKPLVY
jgi:hypothetical protein